MDEYNAKEDRVKRRVLVKKAQRGKINVAVVFVSIDTVFSIFIIDMFDCRTGLYLYLFQKCE